MRIPVLAALLMALAAVAGCSGPAEPAPTDEPTGPEPPAPVPDLPVAAGPVAETVNLTLTQQPALGLTFDMEEGENCYVLADGLVESLSARLEWQGGPQEMTLLFYSLDTDLAFARTTGPSPLSLDSPRVAAAHGEHVTIVAQLPDVGAEAAEGLEMRLGYEAGWSKDRPKPAGHAHCAVYPPYGHGLVPH